MKDELPNKSTIHLTPYSIKLSAQTRERINIINGYKDGLTEEIRQAIDKVVEYRYERLQQQLKEGLSA